MTDDAFLIKLVDWAKARPDIAALILTGSRARPSGSVDFFSDYDLEIFTTDSERYTSDSDWMKEIGDVWVFLPTESSPGFPTRLVIFDSGRKVDFSVKSPHALEAAANATEPSELYEQGYRVLMDKRGLASRSGPAVIRAAYAVNANTGRVSNHNRRILVRSVAHSEVPAQRGSLGRQASRLDDEGNASPHAGVERDSARPVRYRAYRRPHEGLDATGYLQAST
jgi:Streptomycin adenylyltransferase